MDRNKNGFFWPSIVDLMTSLFFVMMVLFAITSVKLKEATNQIKLQQNEVDEIKRFKKVLKPLEKASKYLEYDSIKNSYRLKVDINFRANEATIESSLNYNVVSRNLGYAAVEIKNLLYGIDTIKSNLNYLFIIEGNSMRTNDNYLNDPDLGYRLSYERALSLVKFLESKHSLQLNNQKKIELLIVGSGYFGKSRDESNENNNKNFVIKIIPKIHDLKAFKSK